jgi:eukaryotic-like serine/threonine-protein kinase
MLDQFKGYWPGMDKERWALIKEMFEHVADKSPSHRADYLDMVCDDDDALRQEVEALIAAHDQIADTDTLVQAEPFNVRLSAATDAGPINVGAYQIIEQLGAGGMGVVYRARHANHGEVALKLLPKYTVADATAAKRFRREAEVLANLQHPALCRMYECFVDDAYAVLAMELIEGSELSDAIAQGPMPFDVTLGIITSLVDALNLAHVQGIVHRDLKPGNVLLTTAGEIKLIDFGIAKFADQKLTATGQILGTPSYMSPEQWLGAPLDLRTDIWALGVMWFEMLNGQRAFTGADLPGIADAVLKAPIPRLTNKSIDGVDLSATQNLLDAMMHRDVEHRLSNCTQVSSKLALLRQRIID